MNQTIEKEASLLEENIKLSRAIFEQNKKIKRRLTLMVVGNYIRLALIVIPLIILAIYLPPLIEQTIAPYRGLLSGDSSGKNQPGESFDFRQIQELLKELKQ